MSSLSTFLTDNPWGYAVAAVLILLGLALVVVIYRALRGGRIRTTSTRGRQQRLGVVDTHDIGGDRQRVQNIQTSYNSRTFRHVLLPVWISAYQYGGKTYRFLVNGQTGLVKGERPWSVVKIVAAVIAGLVAAYGLYQIFK